MNGLFQQNMAWSDDNIASSRKQATESDQMLASFNAREADLIQRQQANDLARESLQEASVTDPEVRAHVHLLIEQSRAAVAAIVQQRTALRDEYNSVHQRDFRAAEERQQAGTEAVRLIREKHAEFAGRLADLQAENVAMEQEIRALYDQEQQRYLDELKAARAAQAASIPAAEPEQSPQ